MRPFQSLPFLDLLLLGNLVASADAITIRASKGTMRGPSGYQICDIKDHSQQWGCLPSHQCDATQEQSSTGCQDEGKSSCRELAVGSTDHHVMYSGNSFDCLDIQGSLDETIQLYDDGDCQHKSGASFLASDAHYLIGATAHCIEISGKVWTLGR